MRKDFKVGNIRFANKEFAPTTKNNPLYPFYNGFTYGGEFALISQDNLLQQQGGLSFRALDIYIDLLKDAHLYYCWDEQVSEIINRGYTISGTENTPKEVLDFIKDYFNKMGTMDKDTLFLDGNLVQNANTDVGFNGLIRGMAKAWVVSRSFHELIWGRGIRGRAIPKEIKFRDPRRFIYFVDNTGTKVYPKLVSSTYAYDGIPLPAKKFILYNYWAIPSEDPMGFGLGRILYFPVTWKQEVLTYWLTNIDTSSEPTRVGTYPDTASEEDIQSFFNLVSGIARQSTAIMPEGFTIDFKEHNIRNAVELLKQLVDYCDKNISMILLGEATTGEQIPGSRAREEVNNSIRVMKAAAFAKSISDCLNSTLIRWLCEFNFTLDPEDYPILEFNFPEIKEYQDGLTTREDLLLNKLLTLRDLEYDVDMDWVEKQIKIPRKRNEEGDIPEREGLGVDTENDELPTLPEVNF